MKTKNSALSGNCVQTNVTCVKWNLPPISCLGIETGDTMDEVTFAIIDKLCNDLGDNDLSDIDLQCILDRLDITEPGTRTISTLLQLAFDNDCRLYDIIQNVRDLITNGTPLSLDLKCLATFDSFGNQLPYNEQTVLQSLITNVCLLITQVADVVQDIADTNTRIDNLPAPYTEPNLTTCLSGTPKTTSQTVVLLATDYCTFKPKVGLVPEIDEAIGAQPIILDNTDPLFANVDLITPALSLANSDVNQWVFIENLLQRIKDLEACACKFDCRDIVIGFNVLDQEDGQQIVLDFSGDYGNFIPDSFDVDTDSQITFIDQNKKQKSYPIPPGNINTLNTGWVTPEYDISMLDLTGLITVKVCVKFVNVDTGQICCKCEEVQHMFIGACAFCEISAISEVTVIFRNSNANIQSFTLQTGESYVLPSNSQIISVSDMGALSEVPPCLDISLLEGLECYVATIASWESDAGTIEDVVYGMGSPNGASPNIGLNIIGYELNDTQFLFPTPIQGFADGIFPNIGPHDGHGCFDGVEIGTAIQLMLPAIISVAGGNNSEGSTAANCLTYTVIETIPSVATKLKLINRYGTSATLGVPGTSYSYALVSFVPYDDVVAAGYTNLPDSPCATHPGV